MAHKPSEDGTSVIHPHQQSRMALENGTSAIIRSHWHNRSDYSPKRKKTLRCKGGTRYRPSVDVDTVDTMHRLSVDVDAVANMHRLSVGVYTVAIVLDLYKIHLVFINKNIDIKKFVVSVLHQ